MARLPHRRIPYDGQTTAWFATSSLGSLRGHRPTRHSPSDPASPRRACQGVRSAMPPRYLAFEEVKVCLQIPKLDPSAPHFIRSRTLVHPCVLLISGSQVRVLLGLGSFPQPPSWALAGVLLDSNWIEPLRTTNSTC